MEFLRLLWLVLLLPWVQTTSPREDHAPDLNSLTDADLKTVTIRLERTACYGNCPVYNVTIQGDGHVAYEGKANVKTTGAREGQIDQEKIKALLSQFAQAKFLSLPDYSLGKCRCRKCTDMPSAITDLRVTGVSHRVKHDYGCSCAPAALFDLESAIDKAADVEQWTGDVRKQGPFGTTCWQ